jgi:CheY-like chemotaxis protein
VNRLQVPAFAVKDHAMTTAREAAHRAGCDFFLSKPYDVTTLADFVGSVLHTSTTRPQIAGRLPLNFAPQSP